MNYRHYIVLHITIELIVLVSQYIQVRFQDQIRIEFFMSFQFPSSMVLVDEVVHRFASDNGN